MWRGPPWVSAALSRRPFQRLLDNLQSLVSDSWHPSPVSCGPENALGFITRFRTICRGRKLPEGALWLTTTVLACPVPKKSLPSEFVSQGNWVFLICKLGYNLSPGGMGSQWENQCLACGEHLGNAAAGCWCWGFLWGLPQPKVMGEQGVRALSWASGLPATSQPADGNPGEGSRAFTRFSKRFVTQQD